MRPKTSEAEELQSAHQQEHDHDHQNDAETTARIVAPACAVRPRRQSADKKQDEYDEQNCTQAHWRTPIWPWPLTFKRKTAITGRASGLRDGCNSNANEGA